MLSSGDSTEITLKTVGVLGVGNIGIGVVTDLVAHGITAVAIDVSQDQLRHAYAEVLSNLRVAPLLSKTLPRITKEQAIERMVFTSDLEAVASCDFIIENVTEDWNIKRSLYEKLDRVMPAEVCFGVNTSCISITKIASVTGRPANVVGVHFMNPVHLMSTIEVIRGFHTSGQAMETVLQLSVLLSKEAIVVEDLPGFVSNRISHVFMNEAAFALQDRVASAHEIDLIFKKCFGHKMGPLATADLIGLDTVMRCLDILYESYQDAKYRCCPLLRKLVQAGNLGRKTGKGFHDYPKG